MCVLLGMICNPIHLLVLIKRGMFAPHLLCFVAIKPQNAAAATVIVKNNQQFTIKAKSTVITAP